MSSILIGTSGWVYQSWRGIFYPRTLSLARELAFYAREFATVEINSSYYRLPSSKTYLSWAKDVPSDFVFTVKASRFLTHMKKLKDASEPWDRIMTGASQLKSKMGPVLLQFPSRWQLNYDRLVEFMEVVQSRKGKKPRLVFEFRNESWFCRKVLNLLEKHEAAWCIADSHKFKRKDIVTTDFAYFRFHGRQDADPNYSAEELKVESRAILRMAQKGINVYAYFNNDAKAYALANAKTLREILEIPAWNSSFQCGIS